MCSDPITAAAQDNGSSLKALHHQPTGPWAAARAAGPRPGHPQTALQDTQSPEPHVIPSPSSPVTFAKWPCKYHHGRVSPVSQTALLAVCPRKQSDHWASQWRTQMIEVNPGLAGKTQPKSICAKGGVSWAQRKLRSSSLLCRLQTWMETTWSRIRYTVESFLKGASGGVSQTQNISSHRRH